MAVRRQLRTMLARVAVVAVAITALVFAGCGAFVAPRPTAGDFTDVVGSLVRRNMTITTQVAGDPGCHDSALHSNAVRYDVRPAGADRSYPVYVFAWKSQQTFDAEKASFDACVQSYGAVASGDSGDTVQHLPWRAFGSGWPPALRQAVDSALTEAGGIPAPVQPE